VPAGERTLSECFQLFDLIHRVTTDHATITRITTEVVEDLAADNVIYAELRTTPKVRVGVRTRVYKVHALLFSAQRWENRSM
jgi:adenosine deaminase